MISNTVFPLSCCLEFLSFYTKSVQVKYSEDSNDLVLSVYSYNPQYCSLLLRIMSSKLRQNDFALYFQK